METLYKTYGRLLAETDMSFTRYLYDKINWDNRLIVIKGAKGVGKTTMMLQHIKKTFPHLEKALYVSLDNIWFATHTILELAEYHYTHGGTHLFIDEVHKYQGWQREIKNIYDSYPKLNIVVTGSSILKLNDSLDADLSRRHRQYTLEGLSFREYLKLENVADLAVLSLDEILENHFSIATLITSNVKVLPYFEKYLKVGYYPFYREAGDGFPERLQQVVESIVISEIPSVGNVEYDTVYKAKRLLGILAESAPYTLNISSLCNSLQASRNNVLKLIDLMDKAALIHRLYSAATGMNVLTKPEKILFHNATLMHSLASRVDSGTERETYFVSQLIENHQLYMPERGDLMVDNKYLFEVGGKNKKFKQISNIPNSFVAADEIEIGFGNKIPLWMFGLLY